MIARKVVFLVLVVLLGGCGYTVPTPKQRATTLQNLIGSKPIKQSIIKTKYFDIYSLSKDLSSCRAKTIDLYIEGDGLAWIASDTVSNDPTPINPLGAKLFLKDYHKCAVYLARPCQYTKDSRCQNRYWTNERFAPVVIESFNEALNKIKKASHASSFRIFGYSGGGAVATLLSAKRDDISTLVTICGNLDIEKWAKEHYITPLKGSLNPADFADKLSDIKQIHLIGEDDNIVGKTVFDAYLKRFKNKKNIKYKLFQNFDHHCSWVKIWKNILKELDKNRL